MFSAPASAVCYFVARNTPLEKAYTFSYALLTADSLLRQPNTPGGAANMKNIYKQLRIILNSNRAGRWKRGHHNTRRRFRAAEPAPPCILILFLIAFALAAGLFSSALHSPRSLSEFDGSALRRIALAELTAFESGLDGAPAGASNIAGTTSAPAGASNVAGTTSAPAGASNVAGTTSAPAGASNVAGTTSIPAGTTASYESGEKYWRWCGFESRVDWCACFVSWCMNNCYSGCPVTASCSELVDWLRGRRCWYKSNVEPLPGMLIFFDWENDGACDHVGIVDCVADGQVYVVEGNYGDRCARNGYRLSAREIYGYGTVM